MAIEGIKGAVMSSQQQSQPIRKAEPVSVVWRVHR